jgi:chromate transporter
VPAPTLSQLFTGFLECALSGFGGVLAWSHRILVERRKWLTEHEFAELLGLSQILPGGNILNVSIFVGSRFHGVRGALVALSGLIIVPLCLLLTINLLVQGPGVARITQPALRGAAPVVAGLTLATGLKMARARRWSPPTRLVTAATVGALGVAQLPLLAVVVVLAPLGLLLNWRATNTS